MATAAHKPEPAVEPHVLRAGAYENVASMIVSLLVMVGCAVIVLAALWFTLSRIETPKLAPIEIADIPQSGEEGGPAAPEVAPPDLMEVTEAVVDPSQLVPDAIALKAATFLTLEEPGTGGTGRGTGRGTGGGTGTAKPPKWEIRFAATNLDTYAKQLDHFQFELAVVGGGVAHVDYLSQLSMAPGRSRQGSPDAETRPYFSWKRGSGLLENDKKLLAKAGINTTGRIVLQYYPEAIYTQLATLEKQAAGMRKPDKTIFGVKEAAGGYQFFVQLQTFLP